MAAKKPKSKLGNNPLQSISPGKAPIAASTQAAADCLLTGAKKAENPAEKAEPTAFLVERLKELVVKVAEASNSQQAVLGIAEELTGGHGLTGNGRQIQAVLAQGQAFLGEAEEIIALCLGRLGEQQCLSVRVREEALLVSAAGQMFLAPVKNVIEVFRLTGGHETNWSGIRMVCHRGEIIPRFDLEELLGFSGKVRDPTSAKAEYGLVVTGVGKMILAVEGFMGRREAVIKALPAGFETVRGISGAAAIGSAKIALVLEISALFNLAAKLGQGKL